ncbi:MAG: hypothetical protein K6E98_00615 [Lachnospiraceae bacterium]|nr:hypothetical protein [Lachnospiraceae bacterium]
MAEDLAIMDWNSQKRWEREEGRKSLIEDMLRRGKTVEEIVDFCGCSIELVKEVEDRIINSKE